VIFEKFEGKEGKKQEAKRSVKNEARNPTGSAVAQRELKWYSEKRTKRAKRSDSTASA